VPLKKRTVLAEVVAQTNESRSDEEVIVTDSSYSQEVGGDFSHISKMIAERDVRLPV
jgi:hypothetical protein